MIKYRFLSIVLSAVLTCVALLLTAPCADAQGRVQGRVFVLEDGARRPAGGAWARARVDSRTVATAPTAPDGSYVLEGLPAGRIELDAVQPGCYTYEAGGVKARIAVRECVAARFGLEENDRD